jgi:DNA-binding NarL/FixJ family response regulator
MNIFLADDHPLLRAGLKLSLEQVPGITLIGEASDGFSAVEKIQANPPDVALIDVDMPGISGIGAIRVLRQSLTEIIIIVLSTYSEEKYVLEAMAAGADGYVLKSIPIEELTRLILAFHEGRPEISPYLLNLTTAPPMAQDGRADDLLRKLTFREREILVWIAKGKGNKEISNTLFISIETVKSHVKNIYKKLKVKNRVEAACKAADLSIIE